MDDRKLHPVAERALAHFDALFPLNEAEGSPVAPTKPTAFSDTICPSGHAAVLDMLVAEFGRAIDYPFHLKTDMRSECLSTIRNIDEKHIKPKADRLKGLFYTIKRKLKLNFERAQRLYDFAASLGITFNYIEKLEILSSLDRGDIRAVSLAIERKPGEFSQLRSILTCDLPVSDADALSALKAECEQTINPRLKKVDHTMTGRMLDAMFLGFVFESFERSALHTAIVGGEPHYEPDFWRYLHDGREHLFDRNNALWFARIDQAWLEGSYEDARERACQFVEDAYSNLNNHGVLGLFIDELTGDGRAWELAADITLYAERFLTEALDKSFFQKSAIEAATREHINELPPGAGAFDIVNGGFSYLDCFVIRSEDAVDSIKLLLLFQKHRRDETPLPCPACRSTNVQGNSYSSLGVRSWECQNYVCPDRSKSNRGKRYSFLSLLKQKALEDPNSNISTESIQKWRRDVVAATFDETLEMVVKHYSIWGDSVIIAGAAPPINLAGRRFELASMPTSKRKPFMDFAQSPFFNRFLVDKRTVACPKAIERGDHDFVVLEGDAYEALHLLKSESIDGAVTSPPYYNAREYAQWSNIYCYMHDMYNVSREVFRVLKPGALYVYNIFDYFDNDRTVTFSAMGDRRLALSALTIHAFRSAGFAMLGNVVWDKGEIEGKRGFNGGNASPYYQAPFNCWEHVLVFAKPGDGALSTASKLPRYLRAKPVIKMIGGRNVHGHTAPFPDSIPTLLASLLPPGACVLDPFAGSMTTGRVAEKFGLRSISIERDPGFVELGLRLRMENLHQPGLLPM